MSETEKNPDACATEGDEADPSRPRGSTQTHLAWIRTRMALETTLAAWVRTATAMIAFGFAIALFNTSHARHWPDAKKYLGTAERGSNAVVKLHFPGLHPDAARWLVQERSLKAVGLDIASIDYGQSTLFETHRVFSEKNIPAFENVAALDQLPATGAYVVALPMKIKDGSGGPLRIVAWVPEKK